MNISHTRFKNGFLNQTTIIYFHYETYECDFVPEKIYMYSMFHSSKGKGKDIPKGAKNVLDL